MSILDIGRPRGAEPTPREAITYSNNNIPITSRLDTTLRKAEEMALMKQQEHVDEVRAETMKVLEQQRSGEAIRNALEHSKHTEFLKTFPFHSTIAHDSAVGSIRLGAHKRHIGQYFPFKEDMHYHRDGQQPVFGDTSRVDYKNNFESGLATTKFGSGFMRRQGSNVFNPLKDAEAQCLEESQHRKQRMREKRREDLDGIRFGNGFNLISNEIKDPKLYQRSAAKPQGKRKLRQMTSHESIVNGMNALKDSLGRFHMPHGSGEFFDSRQERLYREGTYEKKMTRVLGSLIPSTGVEDQFSKSEYEKDYKVSGLYTSRKPGDYTPRKQPGNPSADDKIRKLWTNKMKFDSRPEDTSIVDDV